MFIQQPFRITAEPLEIPQEPVLLDAAIRMHYTNKAQEYSNDVVHVHRLDVMNPVQVGDQTQADIMISVEADTIPFFNAFIQSFFVEEETETMVLRLL